MRNWVEVAKIWVEVAILGVAIYGVCIAKQEFQKHTAAFNFSAFSEINEAYTDMSLKYGETIVASRTLPENEENAKKVTFQKMHLLSNFVSITAYVKYLIKENIIDEQIAFLLENEHIQQAEKHVCDEICKMKKDKLEWWLEFEDIMNRKYGFDCSCVK